MNFIKKYWPVLLLIAAALSFAVYWFFFRGKKDVEFGFNTSGNVSDILNDLSARYAAKISGKGIGLYVDVPLTTLIKNQKAAAITLEHIAGTISYNGESILQTKTDSAALQSVKVAGKSQSPVTDTVQALINLSTVKFFTDLVGGKKPDVKYNFSSVIAGKPYSFSNSTKINQINNQ